MASPLKPIDKLHLTTKMQQVLYHLTGSLIGSLLMEILVATVQLNIKPTIYGLFVAIFKMNALNAEHRYRFFSLFFGLILSAL